MSQQSTQEALELLKVDKLIAGRKAKIAKAAETIVEEPYVNQLAKMLHPKRQYLVVKSITEENDTIRTYRLAAENAGGIAYFIPGQYLPVHVTIDGNTVMRPYSISSSPKNSLKGFYEITIRKTDSGYVSKFIFDKWKVGTEVTCGGAEGNFYYNRLRDAKNIIGIAGGTGITPFRSMARAIADGTMDVPLTLFYGCNTKDDVLYFKELKKLETKSNGKFKMISCLANEEAEGCERGFITAAMIKKYCDINSSSIFVCGPQGLYNHMYNELKELNLRRKFIRFELFGEVKNIWDQKNYPNDAKGKTFSIAVHQAGKSMIVKAKSDDSVLVTLEKAGLNPPAKCRSGQCGFCRSYLVKGDVFIPESEDGRRAKDRILGFVHPCSSFPLSDLEIIVPRS